MDIGQIRLNHVFEGSGVGKISKVGAWVVGGAQSGTFSRA